MPERLLIRNGRILDPANGVDLPNADVLLEDGRVVSRTQHAEAAHA